MTRCPGIPRPVARGLLRGRRDAFTLVEIVLALGVASLAIIGILALIPAGLSSGRDAQGDMQASNLAQQALETILASDYAALESAYGSGVGSTGITLGVNQDYVLTNGTWSLTNDMYEARLVGFRALPGHPGLDLREVTIAVGYPITVSDDQRTWIRFTTYVAKHDK